GVNATSERAGRVSLPLFTVWVALYLAIASSPPWALIALSRMAFTSASAAPAPDNGPSTTSADNTGNNTRRIERLLSTERTVERITPEGRGSREASGRVG